MKYTFRENLANKKGVISNLHGFLDRNLDTGFKTKWSGFWVPPNKFLDYYAIKLNGVWLDPNTLDATEYGDSMRFHHDLDSLHVEEELSTPEQLPGFQLKLTLHNQTDQPKALHLVLEPGVDIREKSQDLGPEDYETELGDNELKVSSEDKKLTISSEEDFEVEKRHEIKNHYPGEHQRCFIPGHIQFREEINPEESKEIILNFEAGKPALGSIESPEQDFKNEELGRAFNDSIDSLENLVYSRNGKGILAGHPWFQDYWARDTFWSLLGLIDAGYFKLSEQILENFVDYNLSGKIGLNDHMENFPREDTAPLFVIAAEKLQRHHKISSKIEKQMEDAMDYLETDEEIVEHDPKGTWMDTLERSSAVDIQSLWLEAAKITQHETRDILEIGLKEFEAEEYMLDYLGDNPPRTINPAVPLMFGQVDEDLAEKYLSKINAEFSSRYGARTQSMADPGYQADGYHTGSTWGLTTGWAAAANLRYGNHKQGKNLLEKLASLLDQNQPGALPEVSNSETGELLGCPEQAWSAGMLVHVIDSYLLGIKPEEDKVVIDPSGDISCERIGKQIGDEELDLKFDDGEVELLNSPDIEVEIK